MLVLIWLKLYRLASKSGYSNLLLIHSWVSYVNNNDLIKWLERGRWPSRRVFYVSYFISITEFVLSIDFVRYREYPIVLMYVTLLYIYYYHPEQRTGTLNFYHLRCFQTITSEGIIKTAYDYVYNLKKVCIKWDCSIQPFKYF